LLVGSFDPYDVCLKLVDGEKLKVTVWDQWDAYLTHGLPLIVEAKNDGDW